MRLFFDAKTEYIFVGGDAMTLKEMYRETNFGAWTVI